VAVTGSYFLSGTDIDRYLVVIGGVGMIVTAIANPSGIAVSLQPTMRKLGSRLQRPLQRQL
jgi:hypothetical protein